MQRIVDAKKNQWSWVKKLRYRRIRTMHWAVSEHGGPPFWRNKNKKKMLLTSKKKKNIIKG
jgi:hypothetical protein